MLLVKQNVNLFNIPYGMSIYNILNEIITKYSIHVSI